MLLEYHKWVLSLLWDNKCHLLCTEIIKFNMKKSFELRLFIMLEKIPFTFYTPLRSLLLEGRLGGGAVD